MGPSFLDGCLAQWPVGPKYGEGILRAADQIDGCLNLQPRTD